MSNKQAENTRKEIAGIQRELKLLAMEHGKVNCIEAVNKDIESANAELADGVQRYDRLTLYKFNKVLNDAFPNEDHLVRIIKWLRAQEATRKMKLAQSLQQLI